VARLQTIALPHRTTNESPLPSQLQTAKFEETLLNCPGKEEKNKKYEERKNKVCLTINQSSK